VDPGAPKKLSLLDATLLVMGGIIGVGVFFAPHLVATDVRDPLVFVGLWLFGGGIALLAAFTFAELGGTFPRAGGWFVYLREAFGPFPAFLFAWIVLFVVSTGACAGVTSFLAQQLGVAFPGLVRPPEPTAGGAALASTGGRLDPRTVSALVILLVTAVALTGVKRTALVQNACMAIKLAAIATFVWIAFAPGGGPASGAELAPVAPAAEPAHGLLVGALAALRAVFFAYGGWQMAAYVAPQIADARRNLPRALVLGILGVILVYSLVNVSYLRVLGIERLAADGDFAAHLAASHLGGWGERGLALGMAVSCLGFTIVTLFATPWLYVAMAEEGLFFRRIAALSPRTGVPTLAFLLQAAVALVYVYGSTLRDLVDAVLFVEWMFHFLVALALLRLRRLRPDLPRPFRSPLYPLAPLAYLVTATVIVGSTLFTAPTRIVLTGLAIVAIGALVYRPWRAIVARAGG
jgi:APA family basic amino acid/polyamine antiporter